MNDLKAVFRSVFQFLQKLFCQFEALIRGFAEPFHIFSFVLFNTIAVFVADVEIVLRLDMPLFSGFPNLFDILTGIYRTTR